jgi:hypothetical protein
MATRARAALTLDYGDVRKSSGTATNGSNIAVARDSEYATPLAVLRIAVGKISALVDISTQVAR